MAVRTLVVDDDKKLQELLAEFLEGYGFKVSASLDGSGIVSLLTSLDPDVVVLDIMLPEKDGLDLLREIRKVSDVPVIMLTARGDETDRIVGLELGADDYLPKPFNPRELLARIRAVLRRQRAKTFGRSEIIHSGELLVDKSRLLLCRGDKEVALSATECRMLEALMENGGRVLSRDFLLQYARERDYSAFDRSVDVHISRLRAKLQEAGEPRTRIKSVWGAGYMWVEQQ
ncbi:MAG: response regulator transcription factor [Spirochaetes bacterium]|nr:response regulator transcription factor [Spirochaetota bacterium]